jgi:hypothetical protein
MLISSCPNDEAADTHWMRSDVDYFLLQEAIACGAEYLDQTELRSIELGDIAGAKLRGERRGQAVKLRARLVVDASGPRGFLSRALGLAEKRFEDFPATQALYSHFIGVHRCDGMPDYEVEGAPPVELVGRRGRVATISGALPFNRRAVRRCARDTRIHLGAASCLSFGDSRRGRLGDAALRRVIR